MRALALALAVALASPALAEPQHCAHIAGGVVDNVVIADPATAGPDVDCSDPAAQIGWTFAGGVYTPSPAPAPSYQTAGLTFLQFMGLFTLAEQAAIISSSDIQVRVFVVMASGAGSIDLANPQVSGGVNYLASLNLIAPARVAVVLAGMPPA